MKSFCICLFKNFIKTSTFIKKKLENFTKATKCGGNFYLKVWKTTINSVVLIITNTVNYSRKIELNEEMGSRGFPFKFWVGSRIIFLNFRGVVGATFKHLGGTFDFFEKSLSFIAQTFRICLNYKSRKISIIYN